jgi:hypothetical protein
MIIYTVVGRTIYEGISYLGLSFTSKEEALNHKDDIQVYENTAPSSRLDVGYKSWESEHPMGYCYDSYDVIEHELADISQEIMRKRITLGAAKFFSQEHSDNRSTDLAGFIIGELISGD